MTLIPKARPMIRRLSVSLAAVLAGCAVGPNYQAPRLALTPGFQAPTPSAKPGSQPVRLDAWWTGFGDPELTRIMGRIAQENLDLAEARARLIEARAGARSAGAALLPAIDASGSAGPVDQSLDGPIGTIGRHLPGFERDTGDYALGLGARWEIDLFGGLRRGREAALAGAAASAADLEAAKVAVEADAGDAYVQVRAYQARIALARQEAEVETDLVALLSQRLSQGVTPELQLHLAEAALEGVKASLPTLNTGLEAALNRLDVLMGAQPGTYRAELTLSGAIPEPPGFGGDPKPGELLRRRPDVIAAEARLRASSAEIGSAVAEYYPKISLSGLIGQDSLSPSELFHGDAQTGQILAGLRWRLFDFGRIDAEVLAARGKAALALAAYRLSVLKAVEEVENALTGLSDDRARAASLELEIKALTTARRQAEAAYEGGVDSLIEVRDADRDLLSASDQLIQAKAGAARAAVASFRALGGGWTR